MNEAVAAVVVVPVVVTCEWIHLLISRVSGRKVRRLSSRLTDKQWTVVGNTEQFVYTLAANGRRGNYTAKMKHTYIHTHIHTYIHTCMDVSVVEWLA